MKRGIESYLQRENVWPDRFDESHIDELVWEEIRESGSAGDFASYLVHRPQPARYMAEAKARYEAIDKQLDREPVCYLHAVERIESLAEGGEAGAMFHMGKICSLGIGWRRTTPPRSAGTCARSNGARFGPTVILAGCIRRAWVLPRIRSGPLNCSGSVLNRACR
ncbi:MAG: hypothetical protein G8D61_00855 [gamma proteobacterium symbiont of Ctena orbiculata]